MELSTEQFEAYAKKIADRIAGHDTAGRGFSENFYSKPNGVVITRLAHNKKSEAVRILHDIFKNFVNNPLEKIDEQDHECFIDHVLANLCGGGFEAEWVEE